MKVDDVVSSIIKQAKAEIIQETADTGMFRYSVGRVHKNNHAGWINQLLEQEIWRNDMREIDLVDDECLKIRYITHNGV